MITTSTAKKLWSPYDIAQYQRNQTNRQLFQGDHEATLHLGDKTIQRKYVSINILGDMLTGKIAEFVVPSIPEFTTEGSSEQQAALVDLVDVLNLRDLLHQTPLVVSTQAQAFYKVSWHHGVPVVSIWGTRSGEYVTTSHNSVTFWYLLSKDTKTGFDGAAIAETYSLEMTYSREYPGYMEPGVVVRNTAYKVEAGIPVDVPLPLEDIPLPLIPYYEIPGMTVLPYAVVNNIDGDGDGLPDSDYTKGLVTLQSIINWITTLRQSIVDYCEFPVIEVATPGTGDNELSFDSLKMTVADENGQPRVKISGWTGNMENSKEQLDFYIEQFHRQAGIPKSLFGESDGGQDSGYARRLSLIGFERMIERRRSLYHQPLLKVLIVAMQLQNIYQTSTIVPIDNLNLQWPAIIPEAKSDTEASLINLMTAGILTLEEVRLQLGYK